MCVSVFLCIVCWWCCGYCRYPDAIESVLKSTLSDADSDARSKARVAFWAYSTHFAERSAQYVAGVDACAANPHPPSNHDVHTTSCLCWLPHRLARVVTLGFFAGLPVYLRNSTLRLRLGRGKRAVGQLREL